MFKIVTLPFDRNVKGFDDEGINRFVTNKHVNHYQAEFFEDGDKKYWTLFLAYEPIVGHTPETVTKKMDKTGQILFDKLKMWRKDRADKEGIPVYVIATNKEFVEIVTQAPKNLEALKCERLWQGQDYKVR